MINLGSKGFLKSRKTFQATKVHNNVGRVLALEGKTRWFQF
jgi:hypothetical protein